METCVNDYFVLNGRVQESNYFKKEGNNSICIYEVVRVIEGIPLFLEDHIDRFKNSLKLKNISIKLNDEEIKQDIELLISKNNVEVGNIRYEWNIKEDVITRYAYYIKHYYPNELEYKRGVKLVSYNALRNDPNIKQYHKDLVEKSNELIKETGAYEVLLINNKGFVTEGNKSNIFFVKNNEIYTAPDNMVLEGITRKKIIQIAKDLNIKIRFDAVQYNNINTFDSAFLTGTSPKVLKICCIDNINFRTENEIIEKISYEYDLQINKYISSHKMNKKCTKY